MRKIYILILILGLGILLFINFSDLFEDSNLANNKYQLSQHYIENGVKDTGAINLVTAILFDYRGFDTLGEATVIFIVVSAISLLATKERVFVSDTNFSQIVYQNISFIIPFLYILAFYLIAYGHLSPGGGFAGGVVIATTFILLKITFGIRYVKEEEALGKKSLLESLGAISFVLTGLLGILLGYNFLANGQTSLYLGIAGQLVSAGIIPILNLATGIKVGSGLAIIFHRLVREE
ncbi:sodium:proton antiporter [Orenia metallireducens]|uniref:Sodium:proton antiporter n=1 Tax=Orenia metallireducens TaxID=1413210 RepID=A0A1C0A8Z7_9FIRM|nr:hydrogen gas-evolving membrane-bound hydrogenase subunit E [Orenia metallireducens]OCL26701.1 sodium:proton antiporter [Orenia metallireducens]